MDIISIIAKSDNIIVFEYKYNSIFRTLEINVSEVHNFLCEKHYSDGIRKSEVEQFLMKEIAKKSYFYIISFLKYHHEANNVEN